MNGTCKALTASGKASFTDKWTETMFKALVARVGERWQLSSFRGVNGGEWCGIVDVLAVRKDTSFPKNPRLSKGDLFEMILVQMKGGTARCPDACDIERLQIVKQHYGAIDVVLYEWRKKRLSRFSRLVGGEWKEASAKEIFG